MLRIGETIDRYRVEALLGQGGMAAVYRARHLTLDSEHAIKVLFITAPQVRARLLREGRVQANLRNPNIVSVTDVLEVQGAPALVMEYVDGPALDEWLTANRPTLDQALWLFRGILRGIHAAHERGVVHRDLKPANVLLSPRPEGFVPKVTDFGLVKSIAEQVEGHTQTGMALGTPEYMSPEQIRDASDVDQRADMWAMGCILYELVCHRRPFQGADKMSTFNAIVAGTYEPPSRDDVELPEMVTDAIRSLLVVDRDQRLSSTGGLASVLYEESESRPGRLAPPPKPLVPLLVSGPITPASLRAGSPHDPNRTPIAGLGVGPTGKPAATRSALPALRLNESPVSTRDTMEMRRLVPRRRVALPLAAITIVLLASGALGWVTTRASQAPIADTERTAPGTDLTVAEEPSSSTSDAVPAPGPAPAPAVRPTPTPAPVSAVAASVPSPPPPSGTATITFQGDARAVWLESAAGRVEPGKVAPGTYTVVADFGDPQPARLSTLTLAPGESRVLVCNSFFSICK